MRPYRGWLQEKSLEKYDQCMVSSSTALNVGTAKWEPKAWEKTRDFFGASSTGMFLETQIPGLVWVYFFLHIPSYKVYNNQVII